MSNSPLVDYKKISPNKTSPRNHEIDTITIHCYVGQASVESMGAWFSETSARCSCNYGIGSDGRIALIVDEADRSWCSSNGTNDNRAITIECASDKTHPYAVNDKVYASLIKLCADICKRNNIKELKWKADKSLIGQVDKQNMTVHRWFATYKECPGEYLYNLHGQIAKEVNAILGSGSTNETSNNETTKTETPETTTSAEYPKVPFSVKVLVADLNYRSEPSMNGTVKGQTGKGIFTIKKVTGDWGKLKSGAGWIYLANKEYCEIQSELPFEVKVSIPTLNIRTGAGIGYAKTGHYTGIGTFTITEVKEGTGSDSGWGKLKSGAGWISLDHTTRIK